MTHPIKYTTHARTKVILANVCGAPNATYMDLLVPTVQHRRVDAGAPLTDHCAGRSQGFLTWVTWAFYQRHMHEPLNYMEKVNMNTTKYNTSSLKYSVLGSTNTWRKQNVGRLDRSAARALRVV